MIERLVTLRVREGLHARPATQFVKLARTFVSDVEVRRAGAGAASAKSAVKLMLLGLKEGEALTLAAEGEDAEAALDVLCGFMASPEAGLDPAGAAPLAGADGRSSTFTPPPPGRPSPAAGVPASEGTAIGPAFGFFPEAPAAPNRPIAPGEVEGEIDRMRRALDATTAELVAGKLKPGVSPQDAQIIEALIEVARDAELAGAVEAAIRAGRDALTAVLSAGGSLGASFEGVDNDYIRARAEDDLNRCVWEWGPEHAETARALAARSSSSAGAMPTCRPCRRAPCWWPRRFRPGTSPRRRSAPSPASSAPRAPPPPISPSWPARTASRRCWAGGWAGKPCGAPRRSRSTAGRARSGSTPTPP